MQIGNLDTKQRALVIAEIGNNHEGSFANAEKLIHAAADAGADAVKFQTFQTKWFTRPTDPVRFARLQRFELTYDEFGRLGKIARARKLLFVSTPLDLESAKFLAGIVDAMKIASGDNDYWNLIDFAARAGKPLIVSTGMTDMTAVERIRDFVRERRKLDDVAFLHCVSSYPAPPEQINLAVLPTLARAVEGATIGYSDHTDGIEASVAAVALGARIIEKHFTLDKGFSDFRDHQLSANPQELAELIRRVRTVEALLGSSEKRIQAAEEAIVPVARRSIVAGAELPAGHILRGEDLTCLRPAGGLPPGAELQLIGRKLRRAVQFADPLSLEDVE